MNPGQGSEGARTGLFVSLKSLLAAVAANGRLRLSLLITEFEEEKLRVLDLVISALATVFLLSLGIILALLFLAFAFWEQRTLIFGLAAGVTLLAGLLTGLHLLSRARQPTALFSASLKEIDKDIEALRPSESKS